jgi:hypothetical protein
VAAFTASQGLPVASRIITDTIDADLIKPEDPESKSKNQRLRDASYVQVMCNSRPLGRAEHCASTLSPRIHHWIYAAKLTVPMLSGAV